MNSTLKPKDAVNLPASELASNLLQFPSLAVELIAFLREQTKGDTLLLANVSSLENTQKGFAELMKKCTPEMIPVIAQQSLELANIIRDTNHDIHVTLRKKFVTDSIKAVGGVLVVCVTIAGTILAMKKNNNKNS
jgi:hypothetical protein